MLWISQKILGTCFAGPQLNFELKMYFITKYIDITYTVIENISHIVPTEAVLTAVLNANHFEWAVRLKCEDQCQSFTRFFHSSTICDRRWEKTIYFLILNYMWQLHRPSKHRRWKEVTTQTVLITSQHPVYSLIPLTLTSCLYPCQFLQLKFISYPLGKRIEKMVAVGGQR